MTRIVLVEDDERISEPLARMLRVEGYDIEHCPDGESGLEAVARQRPDMLLLDLTLPGVDGIDVCRAIRNTDPKLPIVMLTARSDEVDIVVGLGAGADDYVPKPFRVAELLARIKARLRSSDAHATPVGSSGSEEVIERGAVRLDLGARRAWVDANAIDLTQKEFDLLALLMSEAGRAVRRDEIMSQVWDEHWWGSTRTLDTHISTLRRKLGDNADSETIISTVRGVGFRFEV